MDKTFKTNLAAGAAVSSNNGINAKAMLDGNYDTYFTTRQNDTTAVIGLTLPGSKTFDVLCLQENIAVGQRIEHFVLEYKDGIEWKELAKGTTVGYKRLIRFKKVTAREVRVRIISSRLNPTLSELGLYKLAQ